MVPIIFTLAFLVLTVLLYNTKLKVVTKTLASAGFIAAAIHFGALDSVYGNIVLVALSTSLVGDILLVKKTKPLFTIGLGVFLLAHLTFILAFLAHGIFTYEFLAAALSLTIVSLLVSIWLLPHVLEKQWTVSVYLVVISFMLAMAIATNMWAAAIGALLFYISDIFVARNVFVKKTNINYQIGLPAYYAAQLLFAYSVGVI